nr:transposase [Streptomyces sp. PsTaAH-124]
MNKRAWIVFLDESGVSSLPQVRRTYAPRGRTPLLRHRLNWKRASMAAALGYHAAEPDRGPRLCFHLKPGSYDTTALIEVLEQLKVFYAGEQVVLVWDGLSAHWSRAMRAWVIEQGWLTLERLPPTLPSSTHSSTRQPLHLHGPVHRTHHLGRRLQPPRPQLRPHHWPLHRHRPRPAASR